MEEVFLRLSSQGESAAADSAPPPSAASLQPLRAVGQPPGKPAPLPAAALSPAAEEAPQPDVASPRRRSAARPSSSSLSAAALLPPSPGGCSSRRSDLSSGGQREDSAPAGQPASASVGARRSGAASPCKQLCVLLQKRAVCAKRDRKGLFLQHALPVLLPRHVADTSTPSCPPRALPQLFSAAAARELRYCSSRSPCSSSSSPTRASGRGDGSTPRSPRA